MGMRQRLQLASVLLGDPEVLVLDEPTNGLDPEGIAWLRSLLRYYADDGRTVLVSSHLLSEVQQSVDDVVIITRGRLVQAGPLAELTADGRSVIVRTPAATQLAAELRSRLEAAVDVTEDGSLVVRGATAPGVGRVALETGVELHELREAVTDLEQIFLNLTDEDPGRGLP